MTAGPPARLVALDAARGLALVAMLGFHLIWDLGNFGYIQAEIPYSAGVKAFGHAIAVTFLFIVGVSLVLARARSADWRPFWRRLALIAGAAALVSLGTFLVFPKAFVFFGILHCIAVASLLAAPTLGAPWPATAIAAALASLAPLAFRAPFFDAPWLSWIGLSTIEPLTNDYRPLLPWSGAVFAGVAAAQFWRAKNLASLGAGLKGGALSWAGRHSLALYLLHQPLLFGLFGALPVLGVAPPAQGAGDFVKACVTQCEANGGREEICQEACACTAAEAARDAALSDSNARARRLKEIARDCVERRR
jgi:uncharacterized membrane protein